MAGEGGLKIEALSAEGPADPAAAKTGVAGAAAAAATAAGRVKEAGATLVGQSKPWGEFADRHALARPASVADAVGRIRTNLTYFRVNYMLISMSTVLVFFLAKPSAIVWLLLLLAGWTYLFVVNPHPITVGGKTYSHNEKLIGASGVSLVFVFFLTNIASVLFSAVAFACAAIAIHGSMRVPDNLFVDETPQGAQGAGLFGGLFGGAAPAVLASAV